MSLVGYKGQPLDLVPSVWLVHSPVRIQICSFFSGIDRFVEYLVVDLRRVSLSRFRLVAANQPVQTGQCGAPKDRLSGVLVAIEETAPNGFVFSLYDRTFILQFDFCVLFYFWILISVFLYASTCWLLFSLHCYVDTQLSEWFIYHGVIQLENIKSSFLLLLFFTCLLNILQSWL